MSDYSQLFETVVANSVADNWDDAVREWDVVAMEEDSHCSGQCICGKENLMYLYTIRNRENSNTLFPIGSTCIKKFGVSEMDLQALAFSQWAEFVKRIQRGERINRSQLRRRVIDLLQKYGYIDQADHDFLMDMFNRHRDMTYKQQKKFNGIIYYQVKLPIIRQYGRIYTPHDEGRNENSAG